MPKAGKLSPSEQLGTLVQVLESGLVTDYSVAIDGGANLGDWTEVLADRFGKVFAFEPAKDVYTRLKRRMSDTSNVTVRNEALLDALGWVTMAEDEKRAGKHRSRYVKRSMRRMDDWVPSVTVDSLELESCGLMKLDLEGAEYHALLGAAVTISMFRPILIIEVDKHVLRFGVKPNELTDLIKGFGYRKCMARGPDFVYRPS